MGMSEEIRIKAALVGFIGHQVAIFGEISSSNSWECPNYQKVFGLFIGFGSEYGPTHNPTHYAVPGVGRHIQFNQRIMNGWLYSQLSNALFSIDFEHFAGYGGTSHG